MPTPIRCFVEVATRHAGSDLGDLETVQKWYIEVLPTLPPDTINEIFEELLDNDGTTDEVQIDPVYPEDVPLPSLSASPPAPAPLFAAGVTRGLTGLFRRTKK